MLNSVARLYIKKKIKAMTIIKKMKEKAVKKVYKLVKVANLPSSQYLFAAVWNALNVEQQAILTVRFGVYLIYKMRDKSDK